MDKAITLNQTEAMRKLLYEMGKYSFTCFMYDTEVLRSKNIRFDENTKFGEDREFNWKYLCHCSSAGWIDAPLYGYRENVNSATRKGVSWRKTDLLLAVRRAEDYLQQENCPFSDEFNSYMYARAMWAVAKTFAVNHDAELYKKLISEYDVKKCMRITARDNNLMVKIASLMYIVQPNLFYVAIGLKKGHVDFFRIKGANIVSTEISKFSIKTKDIFTFLVLLIYIEMPIITMLSQLSAIDRIFDYLKLLMAPIIILLLINDGKVEKMSLAVLGCILLVWFPQVLSTFINGEDKKSAVYSFIIVAMPCVWICTQARIDWRSTLKIIHNLLFIYVLLNFLSMLIYPKGIIRQETMYRNQNAVWLLGQKNTLISFCFPLCVVSLILAFEGMAVLKNITSIVICVITVLISGSSTAIVGISLSIIIPVLKYTIAKNNKFLDKIFNINVYLIVACIVTILIIFVSRIDLFSYIIVDLLGKDLTLTTRTVIWGRSITYIMQKPVLGYGFMNTYYVRQLLGASHQHNYILHILFQGGLISLLGFIVFLNTIRVKIIKCRMKKCQDVFSASIFSVLIMFISESYGEGLYLLPIYLILLLPFALAD